MLKLNCLTGRWWPNPCWSCKEQSGRVGTDIGYEITESVQVARVTFSDSDSASVPKFLNPYPAQKFFWIWESDSFSNSANHQCNRNSAAFVLKQWHLKNLRGLLLLLKMKSDSRSGSAFQKTFHSGTGSGSDKMQNPSGVDHSTPDPWPRLVWRAFGQFRLLHLHIAAVDEIRCAACTNGYPDSRWRGISSGGWWVGSGAGVQPSKRGM